MNLLHRLHRLVLACVTGSAFAIFLGVSSPAGAAIHTSTLQQDTCDFLSATDGLDHADLVGAISKALSDGEIDVLSFVLFGLHTAATHLWCSIPANPFRITGINDQTAIMGLIKAHPVKFKVLLPPQPEVSLPLVSIGNAVQVNHVQGTAGVTVSWTVTGGFQNVWEKVCYDYRCGPATEYHDPLPRYFQYGTMQAPLNQTSQIYLQPAFGSSPLPNAWVGTVPFEVTNNVNGTVSLYIK